MTKQAIGIIGGMGPMATLDLFEKIISHTQAKSDAEHIRVYVDCHTGIPDRTQAVLYGGESPVPHIVESAKKLASIGADFLLIPCNTSHYFYQQICAESPIPVMNMIQETVLSLAENHISRVALLATDGTCRSNVYQTELSAHGIQTVLPETHEQREVMRLIYEGVKAGSATFDTTILSTMLSRFKQQGVQRIVLGCTELPIGFGLYGLDLTDTVDPATVLACAAIQRAGYPVRTV